MNTKRVILLGLLVMGVAAELALPYGAGINPLGFHHRDSLKAGFQQVRRAISDWLCPPVYAADKGAAPVAHWRFDEAGGPTAYDESANNNDGTLTPGPLGTNTAAGQMWTRQGKIGAALECDGTDDYVSVSDTNSLDLSNWTISFWVKFNSTAGNQRLISKNGVGNSGNYYLWRNDGNTLLYYGYGNGTAQYENSFNPGFVIGNWHNVVFMYNGTTQTVFIDGVQRSTFGSTATPYISTGALEIGFSTVSGGNYINGLIDDVRIYNYARTAAQILVDYNAGSAAHLGAGTDPNEGNPPVCYYDFSENAGTTAYDRSGNGYDGTISGASYTTGKYGPALSFDGNDYVTNTTLLDTMPSALTLEAWFKLSSSVTTNREIMKKVNVTGNRFYLYLRSTTDSVPSGITFDTEAASGGYSALAATSKWHLGEWIHVAATWDATNGKRIYINGVLEASDGAKTTLMSSGTLEDFYIGTSGFTGLIDDVKIYAYARTQAQIAYDYSRGAPVAHYKFDEGGGTIAHNEYSSADSGSAPVGWWRMDEGTGTTTADATGNGNTGTLNPGTLGTNTTAALMWDQTGKIGPDALEFDGTDDYVNIPHSATLNITDAITIEAWVNPGVQTDDNPALIYKYDGSGFYAFFRSGLTTINFSFGAPNISEANSTVGLSLSTWSHVAVTYDRTNVKIYVNGVNTGTAADTDALQTTNSAVTIGKASHANVQFFNGLIDDVRIYNYSRTAEQIYNDYKTTHGTLVGDTKFVDGKIGKAVQFDGTGDYVNCGDDASLNITGDMTVAAWFKAGQNRSDYRSIVVKEALAGGTYWQLLLESGTGKLYFDDVGAAPVVKSTSAVDNNAWHHAVYTRDTTAKIGRLYMDGVEIANGTWTGTLDFSTAGIPMHIGNSNYLANGSYYFIGLIDDVRIYNYARTAEQVMQDYNAGFSTRLGAQAAGEADPWGGSMPVAHWKMDENTGVLAYDASGNGNVGTLTNGPTWMQGKVGSTLSFDGSDDRVKVDHKDILNCTSGVTTEAWIYPTNIGGWQSIIDKRGDADTGTNYALMLNGDEVNFLFNTGTWHGFITSTANLTANNWYHVVASYDNATGYIYINGQSKSVTWNYGTQGTSLVNAASNDYLLIGFNVPNGSGQAFHGKIDDVRIYAYARTQAQIAWDYNRGKPVGHWRMDEASGTTCYDDSDNDNDGTATIGGTGSQTTIAAARTNGATGKFGKCMSFDGTDDYARITNSASLQITGSITTSAWIKPSSAKFSDVVSKEGTYYLVYGTASNFGVYFYGLSTPGYHYSSGTNLVPTGQWSHVVSVYDKDNSQINLYVNGKLDTTVSSITGSITSNSNDLAIGWVVGDAGHTRDFPGLIDDVRIYNYARTTSQIMEDYNQGMAVKLGD